MSSTEVKPDTENSEAAGLLSTPLAPFASEQLTVASDEINDKMAVTNKEQNQTQLKPSTHSQDGIFSLIYAFCKKVIIVGSIYLVGYMGWSVAWLIAPVILSVARDQFHKRTQHRRNIAKASAMASEKDVILARIDELPAWVYFPDVERCEWINRILKQVWPNANHYARTLVKDTIEPNIALALSNYKMNGFRFDRIILGTIPPRIGGVKIYDKNVDRNEIIMDLDLFYASDCDINFYLGGMKGGIKDFQIHGWVRVVMKPLIRSMPLVGGLQIFFLNNPNIDFNLVGVIDFMDMPGLSDLLRRIIVEQIGAIMVLPNKLPITLSNEVPATALKMPEPEGILRIHVVEAKNLMKKDIGVLGKGKSDPYAVISVGAQEFKTQIIENNVNPKWDFWCEVAVYHFIGQAICFELLDSDQGIQKDDTLGRNSSQAINSCLWSEFKGCRSALLAYNSIEKAVVEVTQHTVLVFKLYDWDRTGDDESLGRATIEIAKAVQKGVFDTWLTLEDAKHGLLHIRLQWYKLTRNQADLQAALKETQILRVTSMSTALLIVFIDSAKNLKQARSSSKPDPYLICSVGKQKEQTAMIMRDDSPVWEQGFTFLVGNPDNDSLQIKIFDQKTGNEIGQFTYVLNALLTKPNMEIVSQPFQLQKSGPESKLIMTLSLRILKKSDEVLDESESSTAELSTCMTRSSSVKSGVVDVAYTKDLASQSNRISLESPILEEDNSLKVTPTSLSSAGTTPPRSPKPVSKAALAAGESVLMHRFPDLSTSSGNFGLGRIQLSIRYSIQRQKLVITVHKIMYIPARDTSNLPDPYVKLYLLPGRSKESKRKTSVVKDNCNPIFDATFEYLISTAELPQTELEVTVCSQKGFIYGGSPVIGMLKVPLFDPYISGDGLNSWFDLQPESIN